ncbi:MAG: shikimate dehydrogenase [Salinimicrobium sp.]
MMTKYGLIGKNISYSFSRGYFSEKFRRENIDAEYVNFDLQEIKDLPKVLEQQQELRGLNVTIPYKEQILPFLDTLDEEAKEIGAVNTVRFLDNGKLKGYNTDHSGFSEALKPFLKPHHKKALVLGTGGASKAILYALKKLKISATSVSRNPAEDQLSYDSLDKHILQEHTIIINCTPLGTFPNVADYPQVPVEYITSEHLVFDLIYNPPVTKLMELCRLQGATVVNGQKMLELQAEKAWEIWSQK